MRLFSQRKAAKDFCYQDLLDAFFFESRATKKKALQKRNGIFSPAQRASAFEKAEQNFLLELRGNRREVSADPPQIKICKIIN